MYGIRYLLLVPISNIAGVSWQMDPKNAAVLNLILDTGGNNLSFAFIRDNPLIPSYARLLSAVTGLPEESDAKSEPVNLDYQIEKRP